MVEFWKNNLEQKATTVTKSSYGMLVSINKIMTRAKLYYAMRWQVNLGFAS